jgi:hypothetical protein
MIINEKYDETITHTYNWPKFTLHCRNKFLWSDHTFNSIHWKAFQHQGKKLGIARHTHLLKFVYEWLPIRATLVRINSTASPRCPSCDLLIETQPHIFRCSNTQHRQVTNDCLAQIDLINLRWKVPDPVQIQTIINTQRDGPLNAFEQLRWTSDIVQCVWDSELEHWRLRNSDKHSHTMQETDAIKREQLLATAHVLLQTSACNRCHSLTSADTMHV